MAAFNNKSHLPVNGSGPSSGSRHQLLASSSILSACTPAIYHLIYLQYKAPALPSISARLLFFSVIASCRFQISSALVLIFMFLHLTLFSLCSESSSQPPHQVLLACFTTSSPHSSSYSRPQDSFFIIPFSL